MGRRPRYLVGRERSSSTTVLTAEPGEILDGLLAALREGADEVHLASAVSFAAATRIARFPTSNEFGDWDTALHTFTFANAVEQGLRRSPSPELLRGVLDAAMSVHLDRFLNVPATRLPEPESCKYPRGAARGAGAACSTNSSASTTPAGSSRRISAAGGSSERSSRRSRSCLLRENRNFHTIQCVEAAVRQHRAAPGTGDEALPLIAAARYLAAHAPTTRSQRQTYDIARRLHRGERLYDEAAVA